MNGGSGVSKGGGDGFLGGGCKLICTERSAPRVIEKPPKSFCWGKVGKVPQKLADNSLTK